MDLKIIGMIIINPKNILEQQNCGKNITKNLKSHNPSKGEKGRQG